MQQNYARMAAMEITMIVKTTAWETQYAPNHVNGLSSSVLTVC